MKIAKNSKLLMTGDSITDAERKQPIGEGLWGGVGKGYVSHIDALLGTAYHDYRIRIVNMGSGGDTARDLKNRWQTDTLDLEPDWVSVMIGINDVWRQFDSPLQPDLHVYPAEYAQTLNELVAQTLPTVKGMILMTPYYIEPNPQDAMRAKMDEYGAIVRSVAEKHGTLFVDTQSAFNEVLKTYYPAFLAWDRIHPNAVGQMVLARAFLNAIEFEW